MARTVGRKNGCGDASRTTFFYPPFDTRYVIPKDTGDFRKALWNWTDLVFKAGLWALLLWQFVFQVSEVRGDSMRESFHDSDRLIIDKVTLKFRRIRRGDVIVFHGPGATGPDGRKKGGDYIKRVAGIPGDMVHTWWEPTGRPGIFRHVVEINDGEKTFRLPDPPDALLEAPAEDFCVRRETPVHPFVLVRPGVKESGKYRVPEGHYFVLGDNRAGSQDSRYSGEIGDRDGLVRATDIIGYVRARLMPWDKRKLY